MYNILVNYGRCWFGIFYKAKTPLPEIQHQPLTFYWKVSKPVNMLVLYHTLLLQNCVGVGGGGGGGGQNI